MFDNNSCFSWFRISCVSRSQTNHTLTLCLGRFDERISTFAERKFQRDGIEVLTGCRVVSVSDKFINMKVKATAENVKVPHGMVVWSTGVGTRPVVTDFMEQIGQVPSFYIPFA